MNARILLIGFAVCHAFLPVSVVRCEEGSQSVSFREVLELAGIAEAQLRQIGHAESLTDTDLTVVLQVFERLKQFREFPALEPTAASLPAAWNTSGAYPIGEIFELEGKITSVIAHELPGNLTQLHGMSKIYESQFTFTEGESSKSVVMLSSQIPKLWENRMELAEPVRVRGVLAKTVEVDDDSFALVIADHIGWYPIERVPTGQLLLARCGMDVALLDEVMHRQPFVKPSISREGEAFYAGLRALGKANLSEIVTLAKENVGRVAHDWKGRQTALDQELRRHRELLAKAEAEVQRERQALETRRAKARRDLATTIAREAENGQSSVATMFLQPEREVGELFLFEGTARRAVWIAAEGEANFAGYYEIEVFSSEANLLDNRPLVCCMRSLPERFPVGDEIREPVRIAGVFFKSWRYRGRDSTDEGGETGSQRRLYTPVLLGKQPIWLKRSVGRTNSWALWGGVAFLVALAVLWAYMVRQSNKERHIRRNLRRREIIDL